MRRLRSTHRPVFAAAMVLLILGSAVLAACGGDDASDDKQAASPSPRRYYLALGDSMAYGFQPDEANAGARPSAFDTGYVDVFAARLRKLSPKIHVVNYGCPGETTVTFTRGGCPWLAEGNKLHDAFRGSHLREQAHSNEPAKALKESVL